MGAGCQRFRRWLSCHRDHVVSWQNHVTSWHHVEPWHHNIVSWHRSPCSIMTSPRSIMTSPCSIMISQCRIMALTFSNHDSHWTSGSLSKADKCDGLNRLYSARNVLRFAAAVLLAFSMHCQKAEQETKRKQSSCCALDLVLTNEVAAWVHKIQSHT